MSSVEDLKTEVEKLRRALEQKEEEAAGAQKEASSAKSLVARLVRKESEASPKIYMANARKLDRFRDRPSKSGDPSVHEWVADVKGVLASRPMKAEEKCAFVIEHLAGKARQEILGRGDSVTDCNVIFTILTKVFGDGDTLPQLLQRFYAYVQKDTEDILSCSLALVEIFDRIVDIDPSFKAGKDTVLRGRFAEAVGDQAVRRELRRLNVELPDLSFFEVRDRAILWAGKEENPRIAKCREVTAEDTSQLQNLLSKQGDLLAAQQKQLTALTEQIAKMTYGEPAKTFTRKCWVCGGTDHLKRDCPSARAGAAVQTPEKKHLN